MKQLNSGIKSASGLILQCAVVLAVAVIATLFVVRWRHHRLVIADGFDFVPRKEGPSAGPNIGESLDLTIPRNSVGLTLAQAAAKSPLIMIALVDPHCPACKAAAEELNGISNRLERSGIPYFRLMLTRDKEGLAINPTDPSLESSKSFFVWRTDLRQAPPSLDDMVVPSHLLIRNDGVVIDKWPGTHRNSLIRERMANQITTEALAHRHQ